MSESTTPEQKPIFFSEVQRFRQLWLWGLLGAVSLAVLISARSWASGVAVFFVAAVFYVMKMRVTVGDSTVRISYVPFMRRIIALGDIMTAEAVTYRPVLEAGGWGVRYSLPRAEWIYSVCGNRGVEIKLVSGKRLLIGSNQPEKLSAAIHAAKTAPR